MSKRFFTGKRAMLKATLLSMLNKEKQRPERLHDNKENRKEWVEELVPFIRHEDSAAKDSVTEPPRKKTMIRVRVCMPEWLPRNESSRFSATTTRMSKLPVFL